MNENPNDAEGLPRNERAGELSRSMVVVKLPILLSQRQVFLEHGSACLIRTETQGYARLFANLLLLI